MDEFTKETYRWLDVKGRDVIDVGANIGDTALYFASKGAKHVYAYEPFPYFYRMAQCNVRINHLTKKITLINEGCGRNGRIKAYDGSNITCGNALIASNTGKWIKVVDLKTIINEFKIKDGALKLDCEGCEYRLLLGSRDETLNCFKEIIVKYHYGYANLVNKLRSAGFEVTHTSPCYFFNEPTSNPHMYEGLIHAVRVD